MGSSSYKPGLVHFFIRTMDDAGRYVEHHWTRDGLCASHDEPTKSDKLLWHINLFESGVRMTYETIGATYKCKGPYKIMSNNCIHATNRLIKLVEEEVNHSQPPSRKSASPTFHSKSASPTFQSLSGSAAPSKRSMMSMSSKRSLTSSNRSMTSRTRSRHRAASAASSKSNFTNSTQRIFGYPGMDITLDHVMPQRLKRVEVGTDGTRIRHLRAVRVCEDLTRKVKFTYELTIFYFMM